MNHQLEPDGEFSEYMRCTMCGQSWKRQPTGQCPGVKVYRWGGWPEHLLTKKQMDEAGFQTGAKLPPPAGVVLREKSPGGKMWLYDRGQGVPKKQVSAEQRERMRQQAQETRKGWECRRCGAPLRRYVKGGGLCRECRDHDSAADWARGMLKGHFLILDTETTGLSAGYNEIVQIAVIDCTGKVLLDTLVKPQKPERMLERGDSGVCAQDIHGISLEVLATAPAWPEVYPKLKAILDGQDVVIYNAAFDEGMIYGDCKRHGLPVIEIDADCAMLEYAEYVGDWSRYWKSYRWQPLPYGGHSALSDCQGTLQLIREMAEDRAPR
jgi:DNA polymerase-3 subunit epsilon